MVAKTTSGVKVLLSSNINLPSSSGELPVTKITGKTIDIDLSDYDNLTTSYATLQTKKKTLATSGSELYNWQKGLLLLEAMKLFKAWQSAVEADKTTYQASVKKLDSTAPTITSVNAAYAYVVKLDGELSAGDPSFDLDSLYYVESTATFDSAKYDTATTTVNAYLTKISDFTINETGKVLPQIVNGSTRYSDLTSANALASTEYNQALALYKQYETQAGIPKVGSIVTPSGTGQTLLDGQSFTVGTVTTGTGDDLTVSIGLLGLEVNITAAFPAAAKIKVFSETGMTELCLINLNLSQAALPKISIGNFNDPSLYVIGKQTDFGTISISGYIDVTDAGFVAITDSWKQNNTRYLKINLPSNGYLLMPVIVSNMTHEVPLNGVQGYSATLTLTARATHYFS